MYSVRYDVVCSAGTVVNIHREIFLSKMIGTQLHDELCVCVCVFRSSVVDGCFIQFMRNFTSRNAFIYVQLITV